MVSWSQILQCKNPDCKWKGSCMKFYPLDTTDTELPYGLVCQCACVGGQHLIPASVKNDGTQSVSPGDPKLPGAQPAHSGAKFTFAEAAKQYEQRTNGSGSKDAAFDPADAIHRSQWSAFSTQPTSAKRKTSHEFGEDGASSSKRTASGSHPGGSSQRSASGKGTSGSKLSKHLYNFVLVSDTSAIDDPERQCRHPTASQMKLLFHHGYVRDIEIANSDSPSAVDLKVKSRFSTPIAEHQVTSEAPLKDVHGHSVTLDGWRLLNVISSGQGKMTMLSPFRPGLYTASEINLASEKKHRQAPNFKNLVFIALRPQGPDLFLPLPASEPLSEPASSSRASEDNEDPSSSTSYEQLPPATTDKVKSEQEVIDDDSESQHFSKGPVDSHGTTSFENTLPPTSSDKFAHETAIRSINEAYRLALNLTHSGKGTVTWWPATPSKEYGRALAHTESLENMLNLASSGSDSYGISLSHVTAQTDKTLLQSLDFYVGLADSSSLAKVNTRFNKLFHLGECGLHPILRFLHRLIEVVKQSSAAVYLGVSYSVTGSALLAAVRHFRTSIERELYDPNGFSDLQLALRTKSKYMKDASIFHCFELFNLTLEGSSIQRFRDALEQDFGSTSDSASIRSDSLLGGDHGIHGIVSCYINHLLDVFDSEHPEYPPLYDLFQSFSAAFARKLTNYAKNARKQRQMAKNVAPEASSAQGEPESGPRTRSKSKPSGSGNHGGRSDSAEYIYISPSASDSECEDGMPDFEWARKFKAAFHDFDAEESNPFTGFTQEDMRDYGRWYRAHGSRYRRATSSDGEILEQKELPNPVTIEWFEDSYMGSRCEAIKIALEEFPHPNERQRRSWNEFKDLDPGPMLRRVGQIYHPDSNIRYDEDWKRACAIIMKVITGAAEVANVTYY